MIKEKIIEIRQKNKLTQADFGKVLNIAQFTISRIEMMKEKCFQVLSLSLTNCLNISGLLQHWKRIVLVTENY